MVRVVRSIVRRFLQGTVTHSCSRQLRWAEHSRFKWKWDVAIEKIPPQHRAVPGSCPRCWRLEELAIAHETARLLVKYNRCHGFVILKLLCSLFTTAACIQFLVKPGRTIVDSLASSQECSTATTLTSSAFACPRVSGNIVLTQGELWAFLPMKQPITCS